MYNDLMTRINVLFVLFLNNKIFPYWWLTSDDKTLQVIINLSDACAFQNLCCENDL